MQVVQVLVFGRFEEVRTITTQVGGDDGDGDCVQRMHVYLCVLNEAMRASGVM